MIGRGVRGRRTGTVTRLALSVSPGQQDVEVRLRHRSMTEEFTKTRRRSCFLVCISLLVLFGAVLGFLAGLLVGGLLVKHGHFTVLNQDEWQPVHTELGGPGDSTPEQQPECPENSRDSQRCGLCGEASLLLVSGASYADCDGVYSLTNLTSVWDSKHIVYSRLAGRAGDNR